MSSYASTSAPAPKAGSPLWWIDYLLPQLRQRQAWMRTMNCWYTGDHPLPFLTRAHDAKMRREFSQLLEDSRSNFMGLVVDVVEERLQVEGFRLSASSDEAADQESWDIWQANNLDSESQTAHIEALVKGVSYVSVWAGDEYPMVCVEDPLQTIVGYVPGSGYRQRAAALKVWRDDWTGLDRANVYLPDGIYKFMQTESAAGSALASPAPMYGPQAPPLIWAPLEQEEFEPNPVGVVPIIPLRNKPRLQCEGTSELNDVWRVQSQINGLTFLQALAGYFGAHRQRWAIGLTLMTDNQGRPKEAFDTAIDTLWVTEDPAVKFGEFSTTPLEGYGTAIEQRVRHIATTTRTPRHYLEQEGQSPSGDALRSAESGLVKKVERKQRPFGEGWEEALRLARQFMGEDDAPVDSEIIWASAETRTEAEITDAAIKKYQAKLITKRQALEDLGYSEQAITRMMDAPAEDLAADPVAPVTDPLGAATQ